MPSQSDLDQGGTSRQWERAYLGPSIGWIYRPTQNVLTATLAGTYTVDPSVSLITVNMAALATFKLPSVLGSNGGAQAQPGLYIMNPITIVDIGGNGQAFPITIQPASVAENIMGLTQIQITVNFGGFTLAPNTTLKGWNSISP